MNLRLKRVRTRLDTPEVVTQQNEASDDDNHSSSVDAHGAADRGGDEESTTHFDDEDEDPKMPPPVPVDIARGSKNTDPTVQSMWQVPATAHFCSLFRSTFNLIDFDIEDFEEALIVDSSCAAAGGRSTLLLDLLIALVKGCTGRRDVTLLNYNENLFDLLEQRWVLAGLGPNPLGKRRDKANFHMLPIQAKALLLHYMCEWRLSRPDVEALTKDLTPESLRVQHLGVDDAGCTYWYFYGTRLYREQPPPPPEKVIPADEEPANKTTRTRRGRKKRFGSSAHSILEVFFRGTGTAEVEEVAEKLANAVAPVEQNREETVSESMRPPLTRGRKRKRRMKSAYPAKKKRPSKVTVMEEDDEGNEETTMDDIEGENSHDATNMTKCLPGAKTDRVNGEPMGNSRVMEAEPKIDGLSASKVKEEEESTNPQATEGNQLDRSTKREDESDDNINEKEIKSELAEEAEEQDDGLPAWEQPLLLPDSTARWFVVCREMDDWKQLTRSFRTASSRCEKLLYSILKKEFLVSIEEIYTQKENERSAKMAEVMLRTSRSSDRLEMKRLQREQEQKELAAREKIEWDRLAELDVERRRKFENQTREQRHRVREAEKERAMRMKLRAREERSRRVALRQKRQEMGAGWMPPPVEDHDDGASSTGAGGGTGGYHDELDEFDIELELETMYGQLEKVVDMLRAAPEAEAFLAPVSRELAPDYDQVIEKPMDLTTIDTKLIERDYRNKFDFIDDVNLMLLNCLTYNGVENEYTKVAQRLERTFIRAWRRYFPPNEVLTNERVQQDEIRCVEMLGALDRQIRRLLNLDESDDETDPQYRNRTGNDRRSTMVDGVRVVQMNRRKSPVSGSSKRRHRPEEQIPPGYSPSRVTPYTNYQNLGEPGLVSKMAKIPPPPPCMPINRRMPYASNSTSKIPLSRQPKHGGQQSGFIWQSSTPLLLSGGSMQAVRAMVNPNVRPVMMAKQFQVHPQRPPMLVGTGRQQQQSQQIAYLNLTPVQPSAISPLGQTTTMTPIQRIITSSDGRQQKVTTIAASTTSSSRSHQQQQQPQRQQPIRVRSDGMLFYPDGGVQQVSRAINVRHQQLMQQQPYNMKNLSPAARQGHDYYTTARAPVSTSSQQIRMANNNPQVSASQENSLVYLIQAPDGSGNRMFQFTTKDGRPAPNELVHAVMPQIRRDITQFSPQDVITVAIDDSLLHEYEHQRQQRLMETHGAGGTTRPIQALHCDAIVVTPGNGGRAQNQRSHQLSGQSKAQDQQPPTLPIMTQTPRSNSSPPTENQPARIYSLGNNQFLQVLNGIPYMLRKTERGGYERVRKIDKEELVMHLRQRKETRPAQNSTTGTGTPSPTLTIASSTNAQPIAGLASPTASTNILSRITESLGIGPDDDDGSSKNNTSASQMTLAHSLGTSTLAAPKTSSLKDIGEFPATFMDDEEFIGLASSDNAGDPTKPETTGVENNMLDTNSNAGAVVPLTNALKTHSTGGKPICSVAPFMSLPSPPRQTSQSTVPIAPAVANSTASTSHTGSVRLVIPNGQQVIVTGGSSRQLSTGSANPVQYIQLQVPANAQYVLMNNHEEPVNNTPPSANGNSAS